MEGWDLPDEYQLVKQLGKGGYGYVFEAVHIPTGKRVAIKRMDEVFCNRSHARRILREIAILRRLKSSYVVDIVDIIEPKNPETFQEIYIVLELADKDMKKLIESNTYLTLEGVQVLIYKLLCCLKYLHSAKIIHRDLKPANVLLQNM